MRQRKRFTKRRPRAGGGKKFVTIDHRQTVGRPKRRTSSAAPAPGAKPPLVAPPETTNRKLHSVDDKPARVVPELNLQEWYKDGKLHRGGDNPARIQGLLEEWYQEGELHREGDKPAVVVQTRVRFKPIQEQRWYKHGKLHRAGGLPAVARYHDDGEVDLEWYTNGILDDKKTAVAWDDAERMMKGAPPLPREAQSTTATETVATEEASSADNVDFGGTEGGKRRRHRCTVRRNRRQK